MSVKSKKQLKSIIDSGLCTRCGACVGLGCGQVKFSDITGNYLPCIHDELDEARAQEILGACSGKEVHFPEIKEYVFGTEASNHPYLGHSKNIYIANTNDRDLRLKCASGGLITSVLLWLFKKKRIQGAVVTSMDEEMPWMPKTFIATRPEQVIQAAQSKYIVTSVNKILPEIQSFMGPLAYVGLPCQVHSIRKLQMMGHPSIKNIRYILGSYCGTALHFSSIISLIKSYGENDYRQIRSISFRHGEWPGKTRIEMNSGQLIELPKFHANYLIPFHNVKRCLLCTDLCNEFADLSGGDAWAPKYEERGKGFSILVTRSSQSDEIIKSMSDEGIISLIPISVQDAVTMHSHGFDLKKRGAFIRISYRRWLRLVIPDYNYTLSGFPLKRYIMEIFIVAFFFILGTRLARYILTLIHPEIMGIIFKKTRTIWKRLTHNIKREKLGIDK